MAMCIVKHALIFLIATAATRMAHGGDPDIVSDFSVPSNTTATLIDGNFFTYTGMRRWIDIEPKDIKEFTVAKATMGEFSALNGQSVSMAILFYPSGAVNPPHTHPRSAELLFLVSGCVEVGFVDTANKLYTQVLEAGDMFVFPKGMVHYQYCRSREPCAAISGFGSANAGTISLPRSIFATGIDDDILAKSFKTNHRIIKQLKAGLTPKA